MIPGSRLIGLSVCGEALADAWGLGGGGSRGCTYGVGTKLVFESKL